MRREFSSRLAARSAASAVSAMPGKVSPLGAHVKLALSPDFKTEADLIARMSGMGQKQTFGDTTR